MGNPITNTLPPSLDNFLQDMAQMYADFDYSDVSKFGDRATEADLKALRKLYRKAREAMEYEDDDAMAGITVQVEDLVLGKSELTESQCVDCDDEDCDCDGEWGDKRYVLGCCSLCGSEGTDTVENFLKKYGFEDIDYSCDILDIDPLEEVCEECFKSWLPELNDRTYSEYNDLGIDTRTGEPFGEPFDESVKNKSNLKESEEDLSDYQKNVIKDMVQMDFECGHPMDYEGALAGMEDDEDLSPVAEKAANYYMELVQMGPAGIMDEIEDGWSDDYKAEYGIHESKKNTKKGLKESEAISVRTALDSILAEKELEDLGWTETNEGIEVTFNKNELICAAPDDVSPDDFVSIANRIMQEHGVADPRAEFVTEEDEFITLNFPR